VQYEKAQMAAIYHCKTWKPVWQDKCDSFAWASATHPDLFADLSVSSSLPIPEATDLHRRKRSLLQTPTKQSQQEVRKSNADQGQQSRLTVAQLMDQGTDVKVVTVKTNGKLPAQSYQLSGGLLLGVQHRTEKGAICLFHNWNGEPIDGTEFMAPRLLLFSPDQR
jgi:hypothetical protein